MPVNSDIDPEPDNSDIDPQLDDSAMHIVSTTYILSDSDDGFDSTMAFDIGSSSRDRERDRERERERE